MKFKVGDKVFLVKCSTNSSWWPSTTDKTKQIFVDACNNKTLATVTKFSSDGVGGFMYYIDIIENLSLYPCELIHSSNTIKNFNYENGGNI